MNNNYLLHLGAMNTDPNVPTPRYQVAVTEAIARLTEDEMLECVSGDRFLEAYRLQVLNHLKHVSLSYIIEQGSENYPHDYVLEGPYPFRPTVLALRKYEDFLETLGTAHTMDRLSPKHMFVDHDSRAEERQMNKQKRIINELIHNPVSHYFDMRERVSRDGFAALFPEFTSLIELFKLRLTSSDRVKQVCERNVYAEYCRRRELAMIDDFGDLSEGVPYAAGVLLIERLVEFFDLIEREIEPRPDLYHTDRYEYYRYYLLAQKDHIFFPTAAPIGATGLLKLRCVPIGIIGANTTCEYVDGFWQTPIEFWGHDVNHCRRMYQFMIEEAKRKELDLIDFIYLSEEFSEKIMIPLIVEGGASDALLRTFIRMTFFEIGHEDALPATAEVVMKALFRQPDEITPFERIENGQVIYFMEPGATTLAYVFRKMLHTFYDRPGKRRSFLGDEDDRTRSIVVDAAVEIYKALGGDDPNVRRAFELLVVNDAGFPENFFSTVLDDMSKRLGQKGHKMAFRATYPTDAQTAIHRIKASGKQVVTLFGFSKLGYADDSLLEKNVRHALKQYHPDNTLVAIGATPEGIGKMYSVIDSMGFESIGIVSSRSVVRGGYYHPKVGDIFVINDPIWGGMDPESGDISATTETFLQASDIILAFGGNNITAFTLNEAHMRGVPFEYIPMLMGAQPREGNDPYGTARAVVEGLT